jgi:hypothetical protein
MLRLKSFDLKVQGSETAGYTVEVVGPTGERTTAPMNWASVTVLASDLEAIRQGNAGQGMLQRVGTALFQALFPLEVMMVYVAVRAQLGEDEGLRLRLHLPPQLARWPWELLHYPPHYLALDPRTPVVRFLDLPGTPRPLSTQPPLRLLHLVASPLDARRLDAEREVTQLQAALASLGDQATILPGRPGTLARLREALRQGCHVLHFSGHGGFSGTEGYLLFEDEAGTGQPVDGDTLAQLLQGSRVRLAVLNACQSATATDTDAFASVAAALVRAGLPAVIAHQYPLPDSSAIPFAAEFYRALAAGYPVDAAVSEGRKAILSELGPSWRERIDWATPVLLMRAPDGQILTLAADEEKAATSGPIQVIIGDGTVTFGHSWEPVTINMGDRVPAAPREKSAAADPLPALLNQLRDLVRDRAPEPVRAQALEKVAILKGAAADQHPDLDLLESAWHWFEVEAPALSGAVLSAILAFEPRFKGASDALLQEFRRRFADPW